MMMIMTTLMVVVVKTILAVGVLGVGGWFVDR